MHVILYLALYLDWKKVADCSATRCPVSALPPPPPPPLLKNFLRLCVALNLIVRSTCNLTHTKFKRKPYGPRYLFTASNKFPAFPTLPYLTCCAFDVFLVSGSQLEIRRKEQFRKLDFRIIVSL